MHCLENDTTTGDPIDCRILHAALALFVARGFHNVSVHDIQRRAGVSIGSIYNHFGGKEGIARALYEQVLQQMEALVTEALAGGDLRAAHRALVARLFEWTETRPDLMAYVFQARHREFLPDTPPICSAAPFRRLRDRVAQAMARGELRRGDPWVVTSTLFGNAIRLVQLRLDGLVDTPLPARAEETVALAWRAVAP